MRPARKRLLVRGLASLTVAGGLFVGVVGFAHTRAGRPLLAKLGFLAPASCPLNVANADPAALEPRRAAALVARRGERVAEARPAFGFTLGASHADVDAWRGRVGASCREELHGALLQCEHVPPGALPEGAGAPLGNAPIDQLTLRFTPDGALVGVGIQQHAASPRAAAESVGALERDLADAVGEPTETRGARTEDHLGRPLATYESARRFADYVADVSAVNLAGRGILVRAQTQTIPKT